MSDKIIFDLLQLGVSEDSCAIAFLYRALGVRLKMIHYAEIIYFHFDYSILKGIGSVKGRAQKICHLRTCCRHKKKLRYKLYINNLCIYFILKVALFIYICWLRCRDVFLWGLDKGRFGAPDNFDDNFFSLRLKVVILSLYCLKYFPVIDRQIHATFNAYF